jgi:hypothetical protein
VQELQLPPGALELKRACVAPVRDGGALGHPPIVLVQSDTLALADRAASRSRWASRASVGCATAFSCTVVSSTTRSGSLVSIIPAPETLLQQRGDLLLPQLLALAAPNAESPFSYNERYKHFDRFDCVGLSFSFVTGA